MIVKFKILHDRHTSSRKLLEDGEWSDYVHSMDAVCREYEGTNLSAIAWKLCMAFLDDTEIIQKKLKEISEKS